MPNSVHHPVGSSECTSLSTAYLNPKMPSLLGEELWSTTRGRGEPLYFSHSLQDILDTVALGLAPGMASCQCHH